MANEFSHATVGTNLTQAEFESTGLHTANSQAQGDILYCDGTYWLRLGAGTNGQFLKTQGAGANPTWSNLASYTDWTPTVTQSTSVTVTVVEAKYQVVGSMCHIYARLTATSTGTSGNDIVIGGVPAAVQAALTAMPAGTSYVSNGGTNYWGIVFIESSASYKLYDTNTRGAEGTNPAFGLSSGDAIRFELNYRV